MRPVPPCPASPMSCPAVTRAGEARPVPCQRLAPRCHASHVPSRGTTTARRARDISPACHISRDISAASPARNGHSRRVPPPTNPHPPPQNRPGRFGSCNPSLQTDFSDSFPNGPPYWPLPTLGPPDRLSLRGSLLPLPPYGSPLWVCTPVGSLLGGGPFS